MWPELDQLLRDEDDATTVSTPYTAAVLEYRVVFYDPENAPLEDKNWSNANGQAVHDAQHPCRYYNNYVPSIFSGGYLIHYFCTFHLNLLCFY